MSLVLVVGLHGAFLLQVTSGGPGQCQPVEPKGDPSFHHVLMLKGPEQYSIF